MITELHDCFDYVDCDIPAGMTIAAWQRQRVAAEGCAQVHGLRRLLRLGRAT